MSHPKAAWHPNGSVLQPLALQSHGLPTSALRSKSGSSSTGSVGSAVTRTSSHNSQQSLASFSYDRSRDASNPRPSHTELLQSNRHLEHGGIPYKAGFLQLRMAGNGILKKNIDRYVELAGPCIMVSASPNTAIEGSSHQIYGGNVTSEPVPGSHRIIIKTAAGERLSFMAETREDHLLWMKELKRASTRHINHDYKFDRIMGRTPLGSVALARDHVSGTMASVRITSKKSNPDELIALARREAMNLVSCPPLPTIASLLDIYETPTSIYCVTECVPAGTSIREIVRGRRPMSERDTSFVIQSLLQTLVALHDCKIVHRGCSADSVHLESPERPERGVKLTSFEFALGELDSPSDVASPIDLLRYEGKDSAIDKSLAAFVAPEVVKGNTRSYAQDSWSTGILMHYCLVAATPFDGAGRSTSDAINVLRSACGMPSFSGCMWDGISNDARDLCAKLLHADPRRRLTPETALSHAWFRWNS